MKQKNWYYGLLFIIVAHAGLLINAATIIDQIDASITQLTAAQSNVQKLQTQLKKAYASVNTMVLGGIDTLKKDSLNPNQKKINGMIKTVDSKTVKDWGSMLCLSGDDGLKSRLKDLKGIIDDAQGFVDKIYNNFDSVNENLNPVSDPLKIYFYLSDADKNFTQAIQNLNELKSELGQL